MAGFKETPRQKMIGMMYLVLTALLALNVSKELLDAFVIVNESVVETRENFSGKVNILHTEFSKQNDIDPKKVGPYYDKSIIVKEKSENLINYIDSLKSYIISVTEGIPMSEADTITLAFVTKKDQYEKPSQNLNGMLKNGHGYVLMDKINQYRDAMMGIIDPDDQASFKMGLEVNGKYRDGGVPHDWVEHNFYHTILAADITIFNKLANDVRNVEYDVVNYLFKDITKEDFKVGNITAKVLSKSVYVFQGDSYEAEIFVAAVDESSKPTVDYVMNVDKWSDNLLSSAGDPIQGDSGVVRLTINTKGKEPREYTFAGRIGIKKPTGGIMYKNFNSSFFVLAPSANVAATKMNVFYRGVDNPITISAAGIPESQLGYNIVGDGRIVKSKDGLVVKNLTKRSVQNVTVKLFSKGKNGQNKPLGQQEFRVKNLPDPEVFITGVSDKGVVSKQAFLANPYIRSALPESVNFDYKFKVVGFVLWARKNGSDKKMVSKSSKLTPEMVDYIKSLRKNSLLVFAEIYAQGPVKRRNLGSYLIKLN